MRKPTHPPVAKAIETGLKAHADPERARQMARYFRTGKGEYGEGDRFLGVPVPRLRAIAKRHAREADREDVLGLLASEFHELRLTGIFLLVYLFEAAQKNDKGGDWIDLYLSQTDRMNNWDLVDSGAYKVLGIWLLDHDRSILYTLAASESLWENRIAMVATLALIRKGEVDDTIRLADRFLSHPHDLMHKAAGWMLREAWARSPATVETFLRRCLDRMPRTMLRYAIEKMPAALRASYLSGG